nr:c-type cytochrome [Sphingomonas sp. CDS-1]
MKKYIALGVAAIIIVALAIFGPSLLDIYRLQSFVTASTDAEKAGGGPWPRVTDTCIMCHGVQGRSVNQNYPSLAGQPAAYLAAQLHNFSNGQRTSPNMAPLAMTLSEAEIKSLSDYFARQAPGANPFFKADAATLAKGKQLVEAGGCAACHGERMTGQDSFPRLAGQGYDYMVRQLDAFAAGTRTEATGTMKALATAASQDERKAMAGYLASLSAEGK